MRNFFDLSKEDKKGFVDKFTDDTNRSRGQTVFLLELLEGDMDKLLELELKLKNNFVMYCPSDRESVDEVFNMGYDSNRRKKMWFTLKLLEDYL